MGLMEILGDILHHLGTQGAGALGLKIAQHLRQLFEDVSNSVRLRGSYPSPPIRADVAAAPPPLPGLMGKVRRGRSPEGTWLQGRMVPGGFQAASKMAVPTSRALFTQRMWAGWWLGSERRRAAGWP